MLSYEYEGCVTGFSENGEITLIQSAQILTGILREPNEYTERLVGIKLLRPLDVGTFKFDGNQKFDGTAKFA